jgi:hypothetical protein
MRSRWKWKLWTWAVCSACFLSCLGGTATGGEARHGGVAARTSDEKKIHLQLRIAKARRKPDSLRYYQSAARQLKTGKVAIASGSGKGFNRPASSPPGTR